MHALITRPQDDAKPLAEALAAKGIDCTIEPLLQIVPIAETAINLDNIQALLFTSANGVRACAAKSARRDLKVLAIGEGSAAAAREAGFADVESAGGDVATLATLVIDRLDPKAGAVFHAAGSVLAGDLKGRLEQAGFEVRRLALYESKTAEGFSPETRMNLTLGGIDLVLLFSPRTAKTFARLWAEAGQPNLGKVTALCLSAAVAREIAELHWQRIEIAERPDQPAMLALAEAEVERRKREMSEESARQAESAAGDPGTGDRGAGDRGSSRSRPRPATLGLFLVLSMLAGGLVAAFITLTAPSWQAKLWPSQAAGPDANAPLAAEIEALQAKIDAGATKSELQNAASGFNDEIATIKNDQQALKDQIAALPASTGGEQAGQAPDLTALNERLAKLEADLTSLQSAAANAPASTPEPATQATPAPDLTPEVEKLTAANESVSQQLAAANAKIAELEALTARLDALEGKANSLEGKTMALDNSLAQIAAAPPGVTARQQLGTALVLATGQLRGALGSDKPYVAEMSAVHDLLSVDSDLMTQFTPTLDRLQPLAGNGAPTLAELQASLPTTEIARAAESEAGGAAIGAEDGWGQRLLQRLSDVVVVRPVGGDAEGDDPLARLARSEAKLGAGDLSGAVAELTPLTGGSAKAAADWLAKAQARLAQDQSAAELAGLSAKVLAPVAGPSN